MHTVNTQIEIFNDPIESKPFSKTLKNGNRNKLQPEDKPVHDWYRFVLSYPPHLVRKYIRDFGLKAGDTLLDPFCGTGTTLVEGKLHNLKTIGVEANPVAHLASQVKTTWDVDCELLESQSAEIARIAISNLESENIQDEFDNSNREDSFDLLGLDTSAQKLLLKNSISALPLHKALVLLNTIKEQADPSIYQHAALALAKTIVFNISNLKFGPEVGVGKIKKDAPVISSWLYETQTMINDLRRLSGQEFPETKVFLNDAREVAQIIPAASIDAVITSPPYPNEKDYSRTTRLESVILEFIQDKEDLQKFKKSLIRSNTRGVYKADDDDIFISKFPEIEQIANEIEKRRIDLGKTSGFEKTYARVTKLYFGGMYRHLLELSKLLKPGAQLAYVVGDQASYLRVMIRTGKLLALIAESIGYEFVRLDLFRTRFATATGEQLREEVIILKWRGNNGQKKKQV
jgi:DNA modification methylase